MKSKIKINLQNKKNKNNIKKTHRGPKLTLRKIKSKKVKLKKTRKKTKDRNKLIFLKKQFFS